MIKVREFAFVGYPVKDRQKARDFYEGIFGLTPTMDLDIPGGFWIEYDIAGQTLALSNKWKPASRVGPTLALEVEDFAGAVKFLREKGVAFEGEPFETPVCHDAIFTDPDGNYLMIHQRKPEGRC